MTTINSNNKICTLINVFTVEPEKKIFENQKSINEQVDTTTATGNHFFQFMCILEEHERNIIREGQKRYYLLQEQGQNRGQA